MSNNTKALRNIYASSPSVPYTFEKYDDSVYNKMGYKGVDVSGSVWQDRRPGATLWPGSGTILQEDPGISWVL